ncbi:MAG TPA: hypothetical protein VLF40_02445 [Candidatus Saccharimonadales bacterium]|nr:hypothetical protein [Candidatus Saccharimonadales bacterium]
MSQEKEPGQPPVGDEVVATDEATGYEIVLHTEDADVTLQARRNQAAGKLPGVIGQANPEDADS